MASSRRLRKSPAWRSAKKNPLVSFVKQSSEHYTFTLAAIRSIKMKSLIVPPIFLVFNLQKVGKINKLKGHLSQTWSGTVKTWTQIICLSSHTMENTSFQSRHQHYPQQLICSTFVWRLQQHKPMTQGLIQITPRHSPLANQYLMPVTFFPSPFVPSPTISFWFLITLKFIKTFPVSSLKISIPKLFTCFSISTCLQLLSTHHLCPSLLPIATVSFHFQYKLQILKFHSSSSLKKT